jgi:type II secretory pathway pseudopilin PulG
MFKYFKNNLKAKSYKLKAKRGQLLIESMIGISIAIVGILGILALLSKSASLNQVVSNQFIGNYLAAEGIEIVKNLIDANIIQGKPWNQGFQTASFEADYTSLSLAPNQNRPLLFDSANNLYSYQSGAPALFTRTINIELVGSEEIKVNSVVKWRTRGGGQFEVNLEDHFFNWR